ncbi:MAG TPA: SdpI family protein [Steroidobacteraceae bacterium]|nr:SdpI family protein [Steroidobacteraceae bacterium]
MSILRRYALALLAVLATFVSAAALYTRLPPRIAVQWNLAGVANHWMDKGHALILPPVFSLMVTVFLIGCERWAVREPSGSMSRIYPLAVAAVPALLLYCTVVLALQALGAPLDARSAAAFGGGGVLVFLGNLLGKVPRNGIFGIRTPWTVASAEVWARTHRLGARLFVLAGLTGMVGACTGSAVPALLAAVVAAALSSTAYSCVVARRLGPH